MTAITSQNQLGFNSTANNQPTHERKLNALAAIVSFIGDIRRANETVVTYEYLSHMSDAELANRGLERSQLAKIAYDECFSRRD